MALTKLKPVIDTINAVTTTIAPVKAIEKKTAEIFSSSRSGKVYDAMSKAEWAAKDRRISRAGVWQAAIQSVGIQAFNVEGTLEGLLKLVEQAAEYGLAFINKE